MIPRTEISIKTRRLHASIAIMTLKFLTGKILG